MSYSKEEKDKLLSDSLNGLLDKEEKEKSEVVRTLNALADDLDKHTRNTKIADLTFASTGIVASGLTIAGVATAPFTFGTSLGLTIGGLALGVSSGVGTIGNTIVGKLIKSKTFTQAQEAKDKYFETSKQLIKFANVLNESGNNELLFVDLRSETFGLSQSTTYENAALGLRTTVGPVGQGLRVAAVASAIATREAIEATSRTLAGVLKTGLMAAKVAGAVISTLSVPLDIYTIIVNSKDIHHKTPAEGAQEIRMAMHNIEQLRVIRGDPRRLQISSDRKNIEYSNDALQSMLTGNKDLKQLLFCTNCLNREADIICLPCGHVTCCSRCIRHFSHCGTCMERVDDVSGSVSDSIMESLRLMFEKRITTPCQELDTEWVMLDEVDCPQEAVATE
ncbi:apolipoprotein L4-like [Haliotis rubra]|uniref:apolipoprotein L4-like n=1 Tax=Haliotis rubra TaxID=36100 RepID=UPI001EE5941D|nr:apolipoprotein L4-like [Haliotis rubra]XP_046580838.1 apolipoprotein L4-like [Haliotis rubra]XP_046580839.1 apolipoprotein L4-like [Haliotis rubra]